jgi:peptide/nickel transport system substrate-binding protein
MSELSNLTEKTWVKINTLDPMNKLFRIAHLLVVILLLLSCGKDGQNEDGGKTLFRYNESAGITSLDPAFARNLENISAVNHLFNGLVQMDDKMNIRPCIATDWDISEDGLVYTFFLKKNVLFHPHTAFPGGKGRKVTAKDFVYSFERIMDPETASPGAWIFSNIDQSRQGNLGFEALDKYTLRIYLKEPFQPFLGMLAMKYCSVIPHEVVEELGDDFRKHPIGTGPFLFQLWKEGTKLVLLRNEHYFEKGDDMVALPYIDAVSITFINDEEVEYLEFLKGNLDYLSGSNGSNMEFLEPDGSIKEKYRGQFQFLHEPYLNTEYLGILMDSTLPVMKKSPLNNKLVRRALNLAIDRRAMIKYLKNGIGMAAEEGFIPNGLPPFKEAWVKGFTYEPDSARKLLQLAGHTGGQGLSEIVLHTTSQYLTLCEYVHGQWSELGFKVRIELSPAATNRELVALSKVGFFRKSWVADYPDAENYLALFYSQNFSPSGPNYTHFKNASYDKLYEKSRVELVDSLRFELYRRMENIIIEESPVIPLYYDEVVRYIGNDVQGLTANPMNLIDLRNVKKRTL